MPKYALSEDGKSIKMGAGNKPVVVGDDGKEFEIDAIGANIKIIELSAEAKDYRKKAAEYKAQSEVFAGIDPAAAKKALATVAAMGDEHKVEIEKIKTGLEASYTVAIAEKDKSIAELKTSLFDHKVLSKFATSEMIKKTTLPPEIAATYFRSHFKDDGTATDATGNVIYSKTKPGTPADFEEAMAVIIDTYPGRDSILKGPNAGGTGNPGGPGGRVDTPTSSHDMIKAGLAARK